MVASNTWDQRYDFDNFFPEKKFEKNWRFWLELEHILQNNVITYIGFHVNAIYHQKI
jgi:DNA/RNA endonuclease G (NUC1)